MHWPASWTEWKGESERERAEHSRPLLSPSQLPARCGPGPQASAARLSLPQWRVLWNCELKETFLPQTALTRVLMRAIGKVTKMFPSVDLHMRAKASSGSLILAIAQLLGLRPRATPRSGAECTTACALNIQGAMYLLTLTYSICLSFLEPSLS